MKAQVASNITPTAFFMVDKKWCWNLVVVVELGNAKV